MGKHSNENDHDQVQQQNLDPENPQSSGSPCRRCFSSLSGLFGLGCVIVLVLSFATLLSAIFWLFPRRSLSQCHAPGIVKLNASVQAYFKLHKPASHVISHKGRLETDIFRSLDLRNTKVAILSLHQSGRASKYTDVKFAVLPVPTDSKIREGSLVSLRSSFVQLFAQRSNLNLTTSSFGQPTSFQVLKFPGGITLDPLGSKPVSGVAALTLSFTLEISLSEIQDKLDKLKNQLGLVLCLETYEKIHVLLSNEEGSTISPPVTVEASVFSSMTIMENHPKKRSESLAQVIQTSRASNLGLDNSVFGKVKSITYSTYVEGKTLESASVLAPAPSPCFPSLC
ncbi:unnamed protein product [Thlaspi arvense]|uniref:DUF7036 domain-containing protein n=1 Tax=Thlaspi arvense TaxID=13288 RepID=A0AAU9RHD5_THLAR|nr:unnamed protein product [Thlaspi arvense]